MLGIKGFGSDGLSLLLLLILIFDKIVIPLYINWKKDKRLTLRTKKLQLNPVNPVGNIKPGDSTICKQNRDKIIGLEKSVENIEEDIKEMKKNNRDDHKNMFDKIDEIKNKRR